MLTVLLSLALLLDIKPIADNERVTVRDVTWSAGQSVPRGQVDAVEVFVTGGSVKITDADGKSKIVTRKGTTAIFEPKGSLKAEAGAEGAMPARSILIDLKEKMVPALPNAGKYPNAFPRPRVKKLFENEHITVWDYTWNPGEPTPMHFHDKDVVVVYLENGALKSTTPDGKSVVNQVSFGQSYFNPRDRTHSEELVQGKSRAIITELK